MLVKRSLHGMKFVSLGEPLDGRDLGAGRLRGHHGAGLNCAAIQMDYASPALPGIAPHMCPGQAQRLAQELHQERSVFDLPRHDTPVDLDFDLSHLAPSLFLSIHAYIGRLRLGKERLGAANDLTQYERDDGGLRRSLGGWSGLVPATTLRFALHQETRGRLDKPGDDTSPDSRTQP